MQDIVNILNIAMVKLGNIKFSINKIFLQLQYLMEIMLI